MASVGTLVIAAAYEEGTIALDQVGAPVAVCTLAGVLVGASPSGRALLADCGAALGQLPHALPDGLWAVIDESSPDTPAIWHGEGGRSLGCSRHSLGTDYVLLTMREISERQQDLTRRLHQQRLETVGQLMATIAHDIRTPLAALLLEVENVWERRDRLEAVDLDRMLQSVRTAASRLTTTVDSLLDYSRVGRTEVSTIELRPIVERIDGLLRPLFRDRDHQLELDLDPNLPPVRANALIMEQALVNLVVNAAEAAESSLRVRIVGRRFEGECEGALVPTGRIQLQRGICLRVIDDGPGVPAELQTRIFDPFYTSKEGGTGLGLPMAREAVVACGGDLRLCESAVPGACFALFLPIAEDA